MDWRNRVNNVLRCGLRSFGEAALHFVAGSNTGLARSGIFNDTFQGAQTEAGFTVVSQNPTLGIILSEWVPPPKPDDAIQVRGWNYRVDRCEKDGEGGMMLTLTKNIIQPGPRAGDYSAFGAVKNILASSLATFGTGIEFWPINAPQEWPGPMQAQRGIFSDKYEGIDAQTGFITIMEQPNLGIRLSEWPRLPQDGDVIIIYGARYTVQHTEVDGEGGATVMLDKVSDVSGHIPEIFNPDEFDGGFQ